MNNFQQQRPYFVFRKLSSVCRYIVWIFRGFLKSDFYFPILQYFQKKLLKNFLTSQKKFSITILSTCNNAHGPAFTSFYRTCCINLMTTMTIPSTKPKNVYRIWFWHFWMYQSVLTKASCWLFSIDRRLVIRQSVIESIIDALSSRWACHFEP